MQPRFTRFFPSIVGALIIGVSLIIALNFDRFVGWTQSAYYELSGRAANDRAQLEAALKLDAAGRAALQEESSRASQALADRQRLKEEYTNALSDSWQKYLASNRSKFRQIVVIRDTKNGDHVCLRVIYGSLASESFYTDFANDPTKRMVQEQMYAAWTYELRDRIADGFVQWLNANRTLARADWDYEALNQMNGSTFASIFEHCLNPSDVWRANRYQRRIE